MGAYEASGQAAAPMLTMLPSGFFNWAPGQSSCSESLYRSGTPYTGHTWLTDDPANYDGSGSLSSVEVNYFYIYLSIATAVRPFPTPSASLPLPLSREIDERGHSCLGVNESSLD